MLKLRVTLFSLASLAVAASAVAQQPVEPTVRMVTSYGVIDVSLFPDIAPLTVANFLSYVTSGAYKNTIIHRSVPGFVLQGGGYTNVLPATPITTNGTVQNEFQLSNKKWTIAMAKLAGDPNSATSQWFFNMADNSATLDNNGNPSVDDGGYTVFGQVQNTAGQTALNKIAALPIVNYDGNAFASLPVTSANAALTASSLINVTSVVVIPTTPAAGFVDAASFAPLSATGISPGELISIFGLNVGAPTATGLTLDSTGTIITNALAATRVLFNGTPGAMLLSASGQVNVVVPYNIAGSSTVNVNVEYQGYQAAAVSFPVVAATPALFSLNGSGKGDAAILRYPDNAGISTANPAAVGDILELFGEGYGVNTKTIPDGQIVSTNVPVPLVAPVLLIDGQTVPATAASYAGGAPTLVAGVLQVNFTVPKLAPGSHKLQIQVGTTLSSASMNLQTR